MSDDLRTLAEGVAEIRSAWDAHRADLCAQWSDSRSAAIDSAHLGPASEALVDLGTVVAQQQEADERARSLTDLAVQAADRASQGISEAQAAQREAEASIRSAQASATEAEAAASASLAQVHQALAAMSRAGAACGESVSITDLGSELDDVIRGARLRTFKIQVLKAFAEELAWRVGPKLVGQPIEAMLHVPGGLGLDELAGFVRESGPVIRAEVRAAVHAVTERFGGSSPG